MAVGVKASLRAIKNGFADEVFIAKDAQRAITSPLAEICEVEGILPNGDFTMKELGKKAGIKRSAASVVVMRKMG